MRVDAIGWRVCRGVRLEIHRIFSIGVGFVAIMHTIKIRQLLQDLAGERHAFLALAKEPMLGGAGQNIRHINRGIILIIDVGGNASSIHKHFLFTKAAQQGCNSCSANRRT